MMVKVRGKPRVVWNVLNFSLVITIMLAIMLASHLKLFTSKITIKYWLMLAVAMFSIDFLTHLSILLH